MKPHVSLFGVPVRFDPSFLFLALILGYFFTQRFSGDDMLVLFAAWIPLVTGAILLHELGHALTGRAFGLKPFIVLHGMGGLTTFSAREHRKLSHGRRILITLAGPLSGIVFGAIVWGASKVGHVPEGSLVGVVADWAVFTTLGWGVLNLVPMLPLDGGQIVATILDKIFGFRAMVFARIGSIVLAVGLGGLLLVASQLIGFATPWFGLFVLGSLAFNNYRAYQVEQRWQRDEPLEEALQAAFAALETEDTRRVHQLAQAIEERAFTDKTKARVAHLRAWASLIDGDAARAKAALDAAPKEPPADAMLEGSVLLAAGDASGAIPPLVEALIDRGDEAAETLARAVAGAGRIDELIGLLESPPRSEKVGAGPLTHVAHALFTDGEVELAGELYLRIFERFGDGTDAFNAACAAMRLDDWASALSRLERAVDAGLSDSDDPRHRRRPRAASGDARDGLAPASRRPELTIPRHVR